MIGRNGYEDILGFTRQTELLITGLGGTPKIVEEFRRRNISTEELADLNEFDLVNIGADYDFILTFLNQMKTTKKKSNEPLTLQDRVDQLKGILRTGQLQLNLLKAHVAYARVRLEKEQINFFVDADISLRASQALKIASVATLKEVEDIKRELCHFEKYINMLNNVPKKKKYSTICLTVSGVGLTAYLLLHLCKKCNIKIY